jgi:hypothetical protein
MTEYWVFQDKSFKRACIHRSNCSVRKGAISPGRLEGTWHGAYTTYEEARRTAAELSPKKGAQLKLPPLPPAKLLGRFGMRGSRLAPARPVSN